MKGMTRRTFVSSLMGGMAAMTLFGCGASNNSSGDSDSTAAATEVADYKLIKDGTLTVAYSNGFPPMEFSTEDGSDTQGFDIDLIKAVADKLGLECKILPSQNFDTLIPTIKTGGTADVAVSSITITDERGEEVDFTNPYLASNQAILALKTSSYDTADDFNKSGVKVSATAGSTGEAWAEENLPNATFVPVDSYVDSFTGCLTGLYTAVVADLPVANYLVKTSYDGLKVCVEIPTGEEYGIAVSKENPNLTKAINNALSDLDSDGTMDSLKTKWFGTTEGM
ncbi:MAG: ABC transporter substrate-binding protein [Olsenella sp.]|nr:ABC transporter substrate-binding protein [Olsenella sp.]